MVREKIVYNGEAKWGPDRTCEQKRDCSGTSLQKCNWGAEKRERESDCQKAVQEISNFLVQAWTHAQELPKKPTD